MGHPAGCAGGPKNRICSTRSFAEYRAEYSGTNVSVSGASVVGKGEKIEGGRNSAFLVFFDGDMPTSGVNQRKGISQDSHKKQKRKTAHRGER